MMKNILVPTDFSNDAYSALFYIVHLMASSPCNFYLLNVYDEATPLEGEGTKLFAGKKSLAKLQIQSEEKLTATFHKIVLDTDDTQHQFQTLSKKGKLSKVIQNIINKLDIDLVVMGSKGETGAKEIFLGSNTVKIANTLTDRPVLAIPKQIAYKTPKEMAFVTDYKKDCTKKTIAPLLFFASLTKASVRVMHISEEHILNKEQQSHRKLLELSLKDVDHSFHSMHEFSDKAMVIDEFLEKQHIDLLAMVHRQRSFFEKLVREPVIKDLSMYADIPFLILPQRA